MNCAGETHYKNWNNIYGLYYCEVYTFDGTQYVYDDDATTNFQGVDISKIKVDDIGVIGPEEKFVYINGEYIKLSDCQHDLIIPQL